MKAWRTFIFVVMLVLSACAPVPHPPNSTETRTPGPPISTETPVTPTLLPDEPPPARAESEFRTDFSKHSVPYSEILSGGPPKDGIPAIDEPQFISVNEANDWLSDREPVVFVQVGDDARAYPIQVLMWHEIVNDTVGEEPLIVSFCPLCNTAIAFKRTFNTDSTTPAQIALPDNARAEH